MKLSRGFVIGWKESAGSKTRDDKNSQSDQVGPWAQVDGVDRLNHVISRVKFAAIVNRFVGSDGAV